MSLSDLAKDTFPKATAAAPSPCFSTTRTTLHCSSRKSSQSAVMTTTSVTTRAWRTRTCVTSGLNVQTTELDERAGPGLRELPLQPEGVIRRGSRNLRPTLSPNSVCQSFLSIHHEKSSRFKKCLYKACKATTRSEFFDAKACRAKAKLAFLAVMGVGCQPYKDAQTEACECVKTEL